jgi:hypothetical protein
VPRPNQINGYTFTITKTGNIDIIGFYLDYDGDGGAIDSLGQGNNMQGSDNEGDAIQGFDFAFETGDNGLPETLTPIVLDVPNVTQAQIEDALVGIRGQSTGADQLGSLKMVVPPDLPPPPPEDYFPDLEKDISNVVFYFKVGGDDGLDPSCDRIVDGFYTVKIDNVASAADDDFDEWYQDALDYIIQTDDCVDASDSVLGVAIKSGKNAFAAGTGVYSVATTNDTAFFKVDGNANGSAPDAVPSGTPIVSNKIDTTFLYDDLMLV